MTVVSQYGAVAVTHPALLVHAATHTGGYSDVLHAVVAPVQAEVSVCVHWTQSLVAVSHAGRAPEQLALLVHSTQVPVVVLQVGVAPVHAVVSLAVHCTHALVAVSHAVRVPLPAQLALLVHWTHALVVVSQTGVPPVQLAVSPLVHWTQALVAVSQTVRPWVCPVQSPLPRHCTQVPALQSGVGSAHWASPVHPVVVQVFVARLHTPPSPQLVLLVHWTQVLVVVLQ